MVTMMNRGELMNMLICRLGLARIMVQLLLWDHSSILIETLCQRTIQPSNQRPEEELTQDHDAHATLEPQPYIDRDPVPKNKSSMLNRGQRKGLTQDHRELAALGPQPYINRDPVPKNKSYHAEQRPEDSRNCIQKFYIKMSGWPVKTFLASS